MINETIIQTANEVKKIKKTTLLFRIILLEF